MIERRRLAKEEEGRECGGSDEGEEPHALEVIVVRRGAACTEEK